VIDPTSEETLSLAAAARLMPPTRNGRRCHLSTILRWILHGARAPNGTIVRLEACRIGSRWLTSRQALRRFAEALTPALDATTQPTPRGSGKRRRASDRAAEELKRLGM